MTFRKSCTDYSVLFRDRVQCAVQGSVCCKVCSVLYSEANCIMGDYIRNELSGEAAQSVYSVYSVQCEVQAVKCAVWSVQCNV